MGYGTGPKLRGLPSVPVKPYGYTWNENRTKLIPTVEWSNVEFICKAALAGATLGSLCLKLHKQGIRSSTGLEWWSRSAINTVLTNPVYGGRYYAQRWQAVEPKKRKGNTLWQIWKCAEAAFRSYLFTQH